jgi:hypothetical protein
VYSRRSAIRRLSENAGFLLLEFCILLLTPGSWLLTSRIPARRRTSRVQSPYRARGDFKGRSPLARIYDIDRADGTDFIAMEDVTGTSYPSRIATAKMDDIVDIWRTPESLRIFCNECRLNRLSIEPSYELRKKPAALEIYVRLPRTNCGLCGEKTCIAFALRLWSGQISLFQCKLVFDGAHIHLRDPLFEVCAGLGIEKG